MAENAQLFLQLAEDNPPGLRGGSPLGCIEHMPMQGAPVTDFRMIRAGAPHRANGGALIIDARALLTEPFSWEALERALRQGRIAIEDLARFVGLTQTVSLEPDPIPLDARIVLVGERFLYDLLAAYDPDLGRHFKVVADFDDETPRTPESEAMLACLIAGLARQDGALPLDRAATILAVEHAARLAGDQDRLTLVVETLRDLVLEAGHRAGMAGRAVATRADLAGAIEAERRRLERSRLLTQEAMLRGIALVDTAGERGGIPPEEE